MKAFTYTIFVLISASLFAKDAFTCLDTSSNGKQVRLEFNPTTPKLIETSSNQENIFLSPNKVCGIPTDFKTSCTISSMHEGEDFNYMFRCDEAYGDVVFLKDSGYSELHCHGENVLPQYTERKYKNCKLSRTDERNTRQSIVGAWQSECQEVSAPSAGYQSIRPVDTFTEQNTATLRVHVFEKPHCQGKEWDAEVISCTYKIGKSIPTLADTNELDLACDYEGKIQNWYEIAGVKNNTLRFGNMTGLTPAGRPKELGSVVYQKLP